MSDSQQRAIEQHIAQGVATQTQLTNEGGALQAQAAGAYSSTAARDDDPPPPFAAVAHSRTTNRWGFSWGQPSRAEAIFAARAYIGLPAPADLGKWEIATSYFYIMVCWGDGRYEWWHGGMEDALWALLSQRFSKTPEVVLLLHKTEGVKINLLFTPPAQAY